jgi:CRISPR/Cas system-associated exonuclease Cas4 (RecB family)
MTSPAFVVAGLAVVAGLTGLLWLLASRRRRFATGDAVWLPRELRGARLAYSEREFTTESPVPLGARIDRAYALPDGTLVLIEFKRRERPRVYRADVVQLSVQRVVLERATGARVAAHAYVGFVSAGADRVRARRVELESELEVATRHHRAAVVLARSSPPARTPDLDFCRTCGFVARCRPHLSENNIPTRHSQSGR